MHLFSIPKLELIQSFEGFGESVAELGFGPGEDFCVYALGRLGKVSAWPRKKKEPLFEGRVEKLNGQIASAAFYAEKECFALAQQSPFEKGEPLSRQSLLHRDPLKDRPKGELVTLYSASDQKCARPFLWQVEPDACTERITHSIKFTPNGQGVVLAGIEATFDPAGDWIGYSRWLLLWKPDEQRLLATLLLDRDITPPWNIHQCIAIDPTGAFIAVGALSEAHVKEQDYALGGRSVYALSQLREASQLANSIEFEAPEPYVDLGSLESVPTSMAFSPDGYLLAMGDEEGFCVAEWRRGSEGFLEGVDSEEGLSHLLFSPEGKYLICAYKDGSLETLRL